MHWKKTLLFILLLLLIGLRHFLPQTEQMSTDELQPIVTSLYEVDRQLEDVMKDLIALQTAADPGQEDLMIMINDKIEIIRLLCNFMAEDLAAVCNAINKPAHLADYSQRLCRDLSFERARIGTALERIVSIRPLVSDQKVAEIVKQSLMSVDRIPPLLNRSVELLQAMAKPGS